MVCGERVRQEGKITRENVGGGRAEGRDNLKGLYACDCGVRRTHLSTQPFYLAHSGCSGRSIPTYASSLCSTKFSLLLCFLCCLLFLHWFLVECFEVLDGEYDDKKARHRSHPHLNPLSPSLCPQICSRFSFLLLPFPFSVWYLEHHVLFRWTYLLPAGQQARLLLSLLIMYGLSAACSTKRNGKQMNSSHFR